MPDMWGDKPALPPPPPPRPLPLSTRIVDGALTLLLRTIGLAVDVAIVAAIAWGLSWWLFEWPPLPW
jgi:hypothetical protein